MSYSSVQLPLQVHILLLSGYRGSGKDTFADILVKHYCYQKVSFANALRKMCSTTFGIPYEWFEDRILKETPIKFWPYLSPRDILIKVGTDAMRNHFSREIWLNLCARKIADGVVEQIETKRFIGASPPFKFVVTDTRFLNELTLPQIVARELSEREILPAGTKVMMAHARIERTKFTDEELENLRTSGHDSDRQYLEMVPDIVIENTGSISDLEKMCWALSPDSKLWKSASIVFKLQKGAPNVEICPASV